MSERSDTGPRFVAGVDGSADADLLVLGRLTRL